MTRVASGTDRRQRLAVLGESEAERTLRNRGMRVLERRYRRRFGEIDLIAEEGDRIVFVEVKTRRGSGFGRPAEAVTPLKQRRLARVALAFLQRMGWLDRPCRFDVVEVHVDRDENRRVCHIVDAFRLWPNG